MIEIPWDITCPNCFETITVLIDTSAGDSEFVQDCEICCRPIRLRVECVPGEVGSVDAQAD